MYLNEEFHSLLGGLFNASPSSITLSCRVPRLVASYFIHLGSEDANYHYKHFQILSFVSFIPPMIEGATSAYDFTYSIEFNDHCPVINIEISLGVP